MGRIVPHTNQKTHPASVSLLATLLNMIESVSVGGPNLVRFDLKYSYAALPTKLLLGPRRTCPQHTASFTPARRRTAATDHPHPSLAHDTILGV